MDAPKLPYPKQVFFIVANEFCERFNYYGMRAILVIYLTHILLFSEKDAKVIYHSFNMFVYFFPIFGAIISDSLLGKFNTILYVSMIYASGNILLTLASIEPLGIPQTKFSIVALFLMAIGAGGIKPCVAAFGGDQFILPQQESQLNGFFSLFYASINAGSLISTFLTPVLRSDVHCFGINSCFPLAFAVPGILMVLAIIIFAAGRPLYKIIKPKGNVVVNVAKCITHAIGQKIKSPVRREHWLDYAEEKYGAPLVNDLKATLHVLMLYLPLPIFWALYDQQGSGWTLQAIRMDGDVGFYTILPDQMQVVNPLLILIFIPLFTYIVYPLLALCNLLKTSLQRMVCGGLLAAVAFVVTAFVSIAIQKGEPILPSKGIIQLRIYNPSTCPLTISAPAINFKSYAKPKGYAIHTEINFTGKAETEFNFILPGCADNFVKTFSLEEANSYGILIEEKELATYYVDDISKSHTGYPIVRTLDYSSSSSVVKYVKESFSFSAEGTSPKVVPSPGKYLIKINGKSTGQSVKFKLGGTYAVLLNTKTPSVAVNTVVVTTPNQIHILWLLPQYFIITAAEIMFSITGLEFAYSQAPVTMKSLLQACFLLTTAFGNLIVIVIESAKISDKQSDNFFFYAGLMVADMLILTFLAMRYKYQVQSSED